MNRCGLGLAFLALAAASLACNFLVPLPASRSPSGGPGITPTLGAAGAATRPAPHATGVAATPAGAPSQPGTPTSEVTTSLGGPTPGSAPSVVDYAPAPGEALLPGGVIEIYFDRAMDLQSTEAAFVVTPRLAGTSNLKGSVSWPDAQTLRFTTDRLSFQPGQSYTVTVNTSALSAEGQALLRPTAFSVQSATSLGVTRVFPAPGSENLPPDLPITVMFDRAVGASGAAAPQPLELSPRVAGQGQWINSSTYQFQPSTGALPAGTRYTAAISQTLKDLSGVPLAQNYTWQFSTTAPTVTQVLPPAGAVNVPLTTTLVLSFSQPMDRASVTAALEIQTSTGAVLHGGLTWNDARTQATFAPTAPWPVAAVIKGHLASSALAAGGLKLAADYAWSFSTPAPQIIDSQPAADAVDVPLTTTVVLTFDQPMDRDSTDAAFSLTANNDRVSGHLTWNSSRTRLVFIPDAHLPYGARLIAAVSQTARAADGTSPLADLVRAFTTVAAPALQGTDPPAGAEGLPYGLSGFVVRFASPMDPLSLAAHIRVTPRPPDLTLISEGPKVTLRWIFEPDTKYSVALQGALADPYGTVLGQDTAVTFHTAPLVQALELYPKGAFGVYSAHLPTQLYVLSCGLPAIETSLYSLQLKDLAGLNLDNMTLLRRWKQTLPAGSDGLTKLYLDPDQRPLPPGLYYVQVSTPGRSGGKVTAEGRQVVVVADSNLTLKLAADEALVWATAYSTGQPLAGRPVQILDAALNLVGSGVTDAKGLFRLPLPTGGAAPGGYYALSDYRDFADYAFTASDWSVWPFQASAAPYQVFLYTDRPTYHPGQTVFLKGIVRQAGDARYQVPQAALGVTVSLWDQDKQRTRDSAKTNLSPSGALAAEFTLPPDAAGTYLVRAEGEGLSGETLITVEDRSQPELLVTASADKTDAVISDTVRLMVEARSTSGEALPGAAVEWQATGSAPSSGAGVTDGLGRFIQPITPTAAGRLDFAARVTGLDGRQAAAETRLVVHPAYWDVTIALDRYIATAGQAGAIHVLMRDWAGQPVVNQAAELVFRHEEWKGGQPQWVEVNRTLTAPSGPAGQAVTTFSPPSGGLYQVEATVQDGAGHVATAQTNLWVASPQGAVATAPLASFGAAVPVTAGVRLAADQPQYRPGDRAEILIASPYTETLRALVTVERGKILLADVITVTGSSAVYSLPVLDTYAPNVFVNVVLMRGARSGGLRAAFTSAQLNLPVSAEQQALRVQLTADKARALPGDTVTFALTATDWLSRPVSAEFSLTLADSAALGIEPSALGTEPGALGDEPAQSPMGFFYGLQPLGVNTTLGLKMSNDLTAPPAYRLMCQGEGPASGTGEGGGTAAPASNLPVAAPAGAAPPEVGAGFVDTAFWQAVVTTKPDGRAQVTVKLPMSLTTWRMEARGVTADTLVGQAAAEVEVVAKPVTIRPIAPRFLVAGDQTTLAAIVTNNTAGAIAAQVALSGAGVALSSPAIQSVSVPALGQVRVEWLVTTDASPSGPTAADLTFSVSVPERNYSDSSRPTPQPLPIYHYPASEHLAVYPDITTLPALNRGLIISREVFKLAAACGGPGQAPCPALSEAHVGDVLQVKLTLIVPRDTASLRVEDYLPAGAEVVGLPVDAGGSPSPITYLPEAEAGRFKAAAGADKVTLLAASVPAGTYELTYQIAARVPGRYVVRPSLAQAVYAPDIYGRGAGGVFTVLP